MSSNYLNNQYSAQHKALLQDVAQAHLILSELCYNHDSTLSLTDLAQRVRNLMEAAIPIEVEQPVFKNAGCTDVKVVQKISFSTLAEHPRTVLAVPECEIFQGRPVSGSILAGVCLPEGDGPGFPQYLTVEFHFGRKAWHLKIEHSIQKATEWLIGRLPKVIQQFEEKTGVSLPVIKIIDVAVGVYSAQSRHKSENPWALQDGKRYRVTDLRRGTRTFIVEVRNDRTLIRFCTNEEGCLTESFEPMVVLSAAEWKSLSPDE